MLAGFYGAGVVGSMRKEPLAVRVGEVRLTMGTYAPGESDGV
jgi:hypothetical protein